jgi:hypothetical protein
VAVQQEERVNMSVPDRSFDQRMAALDRANETRTYRANLKRDIKAARVNIVDILTDPPQKAETMHVFDLLLSVPKLGRVKVDRLLRQCRISPSKTLGGMSQRQRDEIVFFLGRRR